MRVCPECGARTEASTCPGDGLPTLPEHLLDGESETPSLVGQTLGGRYEVDELVGRGGMGWVFRGRHRFTGQTLALKVMRREVARDREAVRRFYREARACMGLRHHHTIKVHDFGISDEGFPFLVMEYLEGRSLAALLAETGPLPPERAAHIATQICKSLDEAHEQGLVHRDLKPSNVFLTAMHGEQDYVKVLDFGIAKFVGETDESMITVSGVVLGTPRYLSPEQAQAGPLDRRSDLYSLGVLLHEMLSGALPFASSNLQALLVMHVQERPPLLPAAVDGRPIPEALRRLVVRLLAKRPDERPATAAELVRLLNAALGGGGAGTPTGNRAPRPLASGGGIAESPDASTDAGLSAALPRRPWRTAASIVAALVAVGIVGVLLLVSGPDRAPPPHLGARPTLAAAPDVPTPGRSDTPPAEPETAVPMAVPAGGRDAAIARPDAVHAAAPPPDVVVGRAPDVATRTVVLRSDPPGATVWEGAAELGQTPLDLVHVAGRSRALRLTLAGHRATRCTVDDDSGAEVLVSLEARRRTPRAGADGVPPADEPAEPLRIHVPTDF